ncbi:MAG: AIM24 family protein, partial [Gemmatimonadales bacterium]
ALSGDTFFITTFANGVSKRRRVAFSSPFPGKIKPVDLREWGGVVIAQKDSFLCAPRGTNVDIAFTRRIGAGFFGGEGFILQRIAGDGVAVLHASGAIWEKTLEPGEVLRVDTGCIVAMESQVQYDIQMVPGIKTALFGGEGLFFAILTGPGRVMLQTMPFSRLADRIIAASPRAGGRHVQEGSALGGALLGGVLGGMLGSND